jgi:deoxyhypusine monooxygenase
MHTKPVPTRRFSLPPAAGNRVDEKAVPELIALFNSTASVLLRHEVAYTLGQMQRIEAVPFLECLLTDNTEHPITRHEAAEALGAIAAPESLDVLKRHAADTASEVSDTCALALAQLSFQSEKGACGCERRPQEALRLEATPTGDEELCARQPPQEPTPVYTYVSPAPAAKAAPLERLREQLLDQQEHLFERYRALFALRDAVPKEGERAVAALCACLSRREESALLKHEVAFVLGQLEHPAADTALCAAIARGDEHGMVRHEAAEALGAIGSPKAIEVLREFSDDPEEILRESCWVALMWL